VQFCIRQPAENLLDQVARRPRIQCVNHVFALTPNLQGTFGIALPTADVNLVGRNYIWNNAFQYRVFRKLWPEVELNSIFFQDGKNDDHRQTFVTPGLVMGRLRLFGRVGFTVGGGY